MPEALALARKGWGQIYPTLCVVKHGASPPPNAIRRVKITLAYSSDVESGQRDPGVPYQK